MPVFKIHYHGHAIVEAESIEEAEKKFWFEDDVFHAQEIDVFEEAGDEQID